MSQLQEVIFECLSIEQKNEYQVQNNIPSIETLLENLHYVSEFEKPNKTMSEIANDLINGKRLNLLDDTGFEWHVKFIQ